MLPGGTVFAVSMSSLTRIPQLETAEIAQLSVPGKCESLSPIT